MYRGAGSRAVVLRQPHRADIIDGARLLGLHSHHGEGADDPLNVKADSVERFGQPLKETNCSRTLPLMPESEGRVRTSGSGQSPPTERGSLNTIRASSPNRRLPEILCTADTPQG